jgi:SLT domain-containing protein
MRARRQGGREAMSRWAQPYRLGDGRRRDVVRPRDERLARAIREIRELIQPWGDGDRARLIHAVLDRNGV